MDLTGVFHSQCLLGHMEKECLCVCVEVGGTIRLPSLFHDSFRFYSFRIYLCGLFMYCTYLTLAMHFLTFGVHASIWDSDD